MMRMDRMEPLQPAPAGADLSLDRVSLGYGVRLAVQDLSGHFARGSMTAVIGPNGGGKSTLLKGLLGLLRPRDLAQLIRQVRQERVGAIFLEDISDPRLLEQLARETGVALGGRLYSDALSAPGGPAATYVEMMQANAAMLLQALAPASGSGMSR